MENKKTIIFADDNELTLKMMRDLYPGIFKDYNIEIYEDGTSLVNRLEEINHKDIHAVVTDNVMPGINGSEIIKKYSDKFKFVLNYGGDEKIGIQAVKDGAFDYLEKAKGVSKLVEIIKKIK